MVKTATLPSSDAAYPDRGGLGAWWWAPVSIAPLVLFRILFGGLLVFSTVRFWYLGWIEDHFIDVAVTFKYFGFYWVEVLPPAGMYALHAGMLLGAVGILSGWYYRVAAALFFACFTYVELIDLTYYLNHHYFVSLVAFLLIWLPAHGACSVDAWRRPSVRRDRVPRWMVSILQVQVGIVYVYAGLAKLNYTWLFEAMPLRIWLPAQTSVPVIGPVFGWSVTPYLFSWFGMLYDLTIVGWLLWSRTRVWAYASVVVFHILTGLLFQIGVFPLVMMAAALLFFDARWHEHQLQYLPLAPGSGRRSGASRTRGRSGTDRQGGENGAPGRHRRAAGAPTARAWINVALTGWLAFQLLFPWRYLLYPGDPLWTEQGYRFGWRVMLMEKAGTATFYVKDRESGREGAVDNAQFLRPHQEKQMAMQPDMIVQYAHFLRDHYAAQGVYDPAVRAEVYVTLNARPSRLLIDPERDLTQVTDGWTNKDWLLTHDN